MRDDYADEERQRLIDSTPLERPRLRIVRPLPDEVSSRAADAVASGVTWFCAGLGIVGLVVGLMVRLGVVNP